MIRLIKKNLPDLPNLREKTLRLCVFVTKHKPMNSELLQSNIILENERVLLLPFENERNIELKEIIFDDEIWKYMGICMYEPKNTSKTTFKIP